MTLTGLKSAVDTRGELQGYIKEKDLNPLFVGILESLLIHKPKNPVGHIVKRLLVRILKRLNFGAKY